MGMPVSFKGPGVLRTNHNHLRLPLEKLRIILTQLRHVPLAEWSGEAAVEDQQYICFSAKIRQTHSVPPEVLQGEIGGKRVECNLGHSFLSLVWFSEQSFFLEFPDLLAELLQKVGEAV
jgi:hypothetical protein